MTERISWPRAARGCGAAGLSHCRYQQVGAPRPPAPRSPAGWPIAAGPQGEDPPPRRAPQARLSPSLYPAALPRAQPAGASKHSSAPGQAVRRTRRPARSGLQVRGGRGGGGQRAHREVLEAGEGEGAFFVQQEPGEVHRAASRRPAKVDGKGPSCKGAAELSPPVRPSTCPRLPPRGPPPSPGPPLPSRPQPQAGPGRRAPLPVPPRAGLPTPGSGLGARGSGLAGRIAHLEQRRGDLAARRCVRSRGRAAPRVRPAFPAAGGSPSQPSALPAAAGRGAASGGREAAGKPPGSRGAAAGLRSPLAPRGAGRGAEPSAPSPRLRGAGIS